MPNDPHNKNMTISNPFAPNGEQKLVSLVEYDGEILIDLTQDTVSEATMLKTVNGKAVTAHDNTGRIIQGSIVPKTGVSYTNIGAGERKEIPSGYYETPSVITVAPLATITDVDNPGSNATMLEGYKAIADGITITGNIPTFEITQDTSLDWDSRVFEIPGHTYISDSITITAAVEEAGREVAPSATEVKIIEPTEQNAAFLNRVVVDRIPYTEELQENGGWAVYIACDEKVFSGISITVNNITFPSDNSTIKLWPDYTFSTFMQLYPEETNNWNEDEIGIYIIESGDARFYLYKDGDNNSAAIQSNTLLEDGAVYWFNEPPATAG